MMGMGSYLPMYASYKSVVLNQGAAESFRGAME